MNEEKKNTTLKCPYCKKSLFYKFEEYGHMMLCLNCGQLFSIGIIKHSAISERQNKESDAASDEGAL